MASTSFGIFLILLGLIFLLERLNIIGIGSLVRTYWPSLMIIYAVVDMFKFKRVTYFNGIIALVGLFLQLDRLAIFSINVWTIFFPVILIFAGIMEITRK